MADITVDIEPGDRSFTPLGKLLAVYDIFPRDDGAYVVEVSILGGNPAIVAPFPTELDAKLWIRAHYAGLSAPQSRWRL